MRHPAMHRRFRIPLSTTMTAYAGACRACGAASMSSASGTASRATLGREVGIVLQLPVHRQRIRQRTPVTDTPHRPQHLGIPRPAHVIGLH